VGRKEKGRQKERRKGGRAGGKNKNRKKKIITISNVMGERSKCHNQHKVVPKITAPTNSNINIQYVFLSTCRFCNI
jgi:hypothetical protein